MTASTDAFIAARRAADRYELTWEGVARTLDGWEEPAGADLVLDATDPLAANVDRLLGAFDHP